jgi:cyclophilin family peptidyl-prolyl cis-trans isomerase
MWSDGGPADHEATAATVIAAMSSKDGLVAGTAIETAETIYTEVDKSNETALRDRLDTALLARAQTEQDPELATALFGTIAKRKLAAGAPACRAGVKGNPVLAKAAVECLKALGEVIELPPIAGAKAPPVDVTAVINKRVIWKLATTRGSIEIELRPDVAPWAVATIVALTRKQYYDGLELHRVVPNFVAQGGDPTQSGWGGPGFAIPAEPSTGAGYVEGGVGMADAGRDSAGSQWFIMHGAAPHLDGRYTWVGKVISGQSAANSLLIGDRVETATVDVKDRP